VLNEKVCLVTGSTSGIGKAISMGLASMGAHVVIVGRDEQKCKNTIEEIIQKKEGARKQCLSYITADLSSQNSIRELVNQHVSRFARLDVIVNNAGVFLANRRLTKDGLEYTFAVNHLAPFLLTNLLLKKYGVNNPMRIITTSSIAHKSGRLNLEDIQFKKRSYSGIRAYAQSKLANVLFTYHLADLLLGTAVTANCFHPGAIRTKLAYDNPFFYKFIWIALSPFLSSAAKGARTALYLAYSQEVQGTTGKYFVNKKPVRTSKESYDKKKGELLWQLSKELTEAWA
jgi:NAD(P)-dependent dehydrogenase (short-subunit alcohol dehydrogenase family)